MKSRSIQRAQHALGDLNRSKAAPVNFRVGDRRTSMRLDPATLDALDRLAEEEGMTRSQVATLVHSRISGDVSLASAMRAFVLAYWVYRARSGDGRG